MFARHVVFYIYIILDANVKTLFELFYLDEL
jgi:hypothetical protein